MNVLDESFASKTQTKREMHEKQALGEQLCTLPRKLRVQLPASESLQAAFEEFDRIPSKEARRRHLQYVGKLMRNEDVDALIHSLNLIDPNSDIQGQISLEAQRWQQRFLESNSKDVITQFIDQFPAIDRQALQQLLRKTLSSAATLKSSETQSNEDVFVKAKNNHNKTAKILYKFIREALLHSKQNTYI